MKNDGRESIPIENLGQISMSNDLLENRDSQLEEPPKKSKCNCKFPSSYTILIIIEIFIFLLTYIIPKGLFDTIEYSSADKIFIIRKHDTNNTIIRINATQEELDKRGISVPLDSFLDGIISKPITIPGTYKRIEGETTNFFDLFSYPIKGLLDSADLSFFVLILGGSLNLLVDMDSLSSGMRALGRLVKGKEFLLLILIVILISIGGSTYGMYEEVITFYPILMPIFLKSKFDGMLSMAPIYMACMCGNMFCISNATSVILASITAGINFIDGIVFRIICLVLGTIITILYLYFYYRRIKNDETKSITFEIKDEIWDKYFKKNKNENKIDNDKQDGYTSEEEHLKEKPEEKKIENEEKFTCIQKISLIVFFLGFIAIILGVLLLKWTIMQMSVIFLILSIIFMFMLNKGEEAALNSFMKGAGDLCGVAMVIGLARGINLTLENEKIAHSILNFLSDLVDGLHKVIFVVLMILIYIVLGFFIQSSSGMAVLTMPTFAPLADEVNCPRAVLINTYMFGQMLIGLIAPSGIILLITQLTGIKFSYWVKFIWPYMLILYVFLNIMIIINLYI